MDWLGIRQTPYLGRRNYALEVRQILAWGVVVGFIEGQFASVVVAKTFNGSDLLVGLASTTPIAMHIASLLWGSLCIGRPKVRLFTGCAAAASILTATVALTPSTAWGGWLFVGQMAAAQFFSTGTVTVRAALWKSNYPIHARGQITSRLQIIRALTRLAAVTGGAVVFDSNPQAFRWVYPVVAACGLLAAMLASRMQVRGERRALRRAAAPMSVGRALSTGDVLRHGYRVLREDRLFRKYCIAQMYAGSSVMLTRAVVTIVIAQQLVGTFRHGYWASTILIEVLPILVMLVTMPHFARYFDRVGVLRFRLLHGACWTGAMLLGWAGTSMVARIDAWGAPAMLAAVALFTLFAFVRGACYGGGSIAWNLGHLHFADDEKAEVYMGVHVALTGVRGLIMPVTGLWIWHWVGPSVWGIAAGLSLAALWSYFRLNRAAISAEMDKHGFTPTEPPGPFKTRIGARR